MRRSQAISLLSLCLLLFGLIMVGSASVVDAARDFADKWYYLKLQSAWAGIGFGAFLLASNFPHNRLQQLARPLFLLTICLLLVVVLPGVGIKLLGARRWINLGFFSFQPSEMAKLTLGIYFSWLLAHTDRFRQFVSSLSLVVILVMLQPDLGTAILITLSGFIVYFGSGGSIAKLFFLGLAGGVLGLLLVVISPYRFSRLKTFFDYSRDPQGASYQIHQALIALGSGGVFGVGLGQSRQKFNYLPEATTDSIFAIIGEELGLVGTASLAIVFFALALLGLDVVKSASPGFSANLALAMTSVVTVQALMNISSLTALLPLTGIPLSFISYGGSSLLTLLTATGILVNVAKTHDR